MRNLGRIFAVLIAVMSASPAMAAKSYQPQGQWGGMAMPQPNYSTCDGGFMTGIHARTGAWFNMIGALCAMYDPATGSLVPMQPALAHGYSQGGSVQQKQCPPNQAIEYISYSSFGQKPGLAWDTYTMLDEVIFKCRSIGTLQAKGTDALVGMTSDDPLSVGDADTTHPYITGDNVNPGFVYRQPCGQGELARGIAIVVPDTNVAPNFPNEGVWGLGLICAVQPQPMIGGAPPPPAPPPLPTQPIDLSGGGSYPLGPQGGGKQTNVNCPAGMALVSVFGGGKANNIDRLQVYCVRFDGQSAFGNPQMAGALGNSGGASGALTACQSGVASAAEGDVLSYGGIARLRLRCTNGPANYIGRNAPNNLENWTHGTITCGSGNVATGIYGWVDGTGAVQSFGFHCLPARAFGNGGSTAGGGGGGGGSGGGGAVGVTLNDFTGAWQVHVDNGYSYTMNLFVSGGMIRGSYDAGRANGQVNNGVLSGNTLSMDLSQSAVVVGSGKGTFHFADPLTLSGTWSIGPYSGTWTATR